ncbi:uncharacterized protein MELLADRAFT_113923 [Melampsora larici-populina 98AG31]|uniref:Uncharacterized protein n=1 Tax=Melampsora larici-populina (strain 98AG31 / pathotype 3-4-7) TaxID=747676 RepID=F4SBI5_MELLP|nr:uncharacterized protein MELLADRAFT_113923 [Melampsora larici-populina 98AG31]EGF97997.1 hypothetical protein MELLADRAFT_113923 [Melampsora larici-populina 98AG31]
MSLFLETIVFFTATVVSTGVARGVSGHTGSYPSLNSLANVSLITSSGIINPSGRDGSFNLITSALSQNYNQSPTIAMQVLIGASPILEGLAVDWATCGLLSTIIALANQHRTVLCLGPDGLQEGGNDAKAARLAEARNLNITLLIDINNDWEYSDNVATILQLLSSSTSPYLYIGNTKEMDACCVQFSKAINMVLDRMSKEDITSKVICINSDLEGSTDRKVIHQPHPGIFIHSGIIEFANFCAAAGFSSICFHNLC